MIRDKTSPKSPGSLANGPGHALDDPIVVYMERSEEIFEPGRIRKRGAKL